MSMHRTAIGEAIAQSFGHCAQLGAVVAALSSMSPACTPIIGELPPNVEADAAVDDASEPAVELDAMIEPSEPDEASLDAGAALPEDAGDALDVDPTPVDPPDARQPEIDTGVVPDPTGCDGAGEKLFFADRDKDEFGDGTSAVAACTAPDGYVEDSSDCNDENALVHPDQGRFFANGYRTDAGLSFDYDCDQRELGAPGQAQQQPCSGGGLLACSGGGYSPSPYRAAATGLNPYCGSDVVINCGVLPLVVGGCGAMQVITSSHYLCH